MKAKLLIVLGIAFGLAACQKDKFNTVPTLTFEGVNTQELRPNEGIIFKFRFTDKEGDIQDSMFVQKVTKNCERSDFDALYPLPSDFPERRNSEGEIEVRYAYGSGFIYPPIAEPQCEGQNDTCVFRFALKDKAGNTSDTVSSPQIILIKR